MAFRDAVERINSDESILPDTRIEAVIEKLERCDSFQASKRGKQWPRRCLLSNNLEQFVVC